MLHFPNSYARGNKLLSVVNATPGTSESGVTTAGAVVDTRGYEGGYALFVVMAGANSATTTLRVKEGSTTTPATNVSGATFTITASTDDNTMKWGGMRLTPRLRYLGMTYQAGTNAAIDIKCGIMLFRPDYSANDNAGKVNNAAVGSESHTAMAFDV